MTASKASSPAVEKLRDCPFCGEAVSPEHHTVNDESESYGYWAVECLRHASVGRAASLFCGVHADTEAEAIAAWNHRPEHDRLAEEVGRLRALIQQAADYWDTCGHDGERPEWARPPVPGDDHE